MQGIHDGLLYILKGLIFCKKQIKIWTGVVIQGHSFIIKGRGNFSGNVCTDKLNGLTGMIKGSNNIFLY